MKLANRLVTLPKLTTDENVADTPDSSPLTLSDHAFRGALSPVTDSIAAR